MSSISRESNGTDLAHSVEVLIVGGGVAGLAAAGALSDRGIKSIVVEAKPQVGGLAGELACKGIRECVRCDVCLATDKAKDAKKSSQVKILTESTISQVKGRVGSFEVEVVDYRGGSNTFKVAAIIVCTGIEPIDPTKFARYGYGTVPKVASALDIERELSKTGRIGEMDFGRVAIIQCVGSRGEPGGVDYCSTVCCKYALRLAKLLGSQLPESSISFFFMDWRACDGAQSDLRSWAESAQTRLVRSRPAEILSSKAGKPWVRYATSEEEVKEEEFDLVILSIGIKPSPGTVQAAGILGIDIDEDGFIKIAPGTAETSVPGIFAAGSATGPSDVERSVTSGIAAASEAVALIASKERSTTVAILGEIDDQMIDDLRLHGSNLIQIPWDEESRLQLTGHPGDFTLWTVEKDKSSGIHCGALVVSLSNQSCRAAPNFLSLDDFENRLLEEGLDTAFILQEGECSARAQHHERTLKCALRLKEKNPKSRVTIVAPEIIAFSRWEREYKRCQEKGILFVRQDEFPKVLEGEIETFDSISKTTLRIPAKEVVIAGDFLPIEVREKLRGIGLSLGGDGRAENRPIKWKPAAGLKRGVFICGSPWNALEGRRMDLRAALEGAFTLVEKALPSESLAETDDEKCSSCLSCIRTCPFEAPHINSEGLAEIDSALCQGCGICVSLCPSKAISLKPTSETTLREEKE